MKYKLVAIDMDGTLLNSSDNVSERTKMVLKKAMDEGLNIVISTGRIFKSALFYGKNIGLESPIISCNGAVISSFDGKEVFLEKTIDVRILKDILKIAEKMNIYYHFYDMDTFYYNKSRNEYRNYYRFYEEKFIKQGINLKGFINPKEVINDQSLFYKIVFIEDDINKLHDLRKQLERIKGISVSKSWYNNLEVMTKGVSKGNSVEYISKMLKIDTNEIVAIGDNENDISMFKVAALSIAMANGDELAKKHADIITDSNDEDGVANAIEKYVLI